MKLNVKKYRNYLLTRLTTRLMLKTRQTSILALLHVSLSARVQQTEGSLLLLKYLIFQAVNLTPAASEDNEGQLIKPLQTLRESFSEHIIFAGVSGKRISDNGGKFKVELKQQRPMR
jgi:hypothetical protein